MNPYHLLANHKMTILSLLLQLWKTIFITTDDKIVYTVGLWSIVFDDEIGVSFQFSVSVLEWDQLTLVLFLSASKGLTGPFYCNFDTTSQMFQFWGCYRW